MKHRDCDKYSVAWFKLSEFVQRGDKERALGIYKLLMHAVDDCPFALQLEGDLLLAFHDVRALEMYEKAAHAYTQEQRLTQAAAVYEHMVSLCPGKIAYHLFLVDIYFHMKLEHKMCEHVLLVTKQLNDYDVPQLEHIIGQVEISKNAQAQIFTQLTLHELKKCHLDTAKVIACARHALELLFDNGNEKRVTQFMGQVKQLNEQIYQQVNDVVPISKD